LKVYGGGCCGGRCCSAPVAAPVAASSRPQSHPSATPTPNAHLGGEAEADPAHDLGKVVGAGDVVEEEPGGDLVALLPRLAQVGEDDVAPQVGELEEQREAKEDEGGRLRGRRVGGVVDEVGHVGGKAVVVGAVLEEVEDGHGVVAKPGGCAGG